MGLEVCEEEQSHPELFCLAVNCLDRFLSKVQIKKSQLQLLASACLLVSWKVREHRKITALKIVKYTNYNVQQEELLEWEVLVLSKLNWNIPPVVAMDFVEHIVQGLGKLQVEWVPEIPIPRVQHPTLRSPEVVPATPRYSALDLDRVIRSAQKITFVEKSILQRCMEELEELSRGYLPPSPSPESSFSDTSSTGSRFSTSSPLPNAARTLFTDIEVKTPTKLLEAATSVSN